jgi:hypothetical protein
MFKLYFRFLLNPVCYRLCAGRDAIYLQPNRHWGCPDNQGWQQADVQSVSGAHGTPEPMAPPAAADFCQESLHNGFLLLVMGLGKSQLAKCLIPFAYFERLRRRILFEMFTDGRRVAAKIEAAENWSIFHLCMLSVIYIHISSIAFSNPRIDAHTIPTSMANFRRRFNGKRESKESTGRDLCKNPSTGNPWYPTYLINTLIFNTFM